MIDFDLLLNSNNFDGIVVILDNHLNVKDANINFLNLLDYHKRDIINSPITDLIIPDEKSVFLDMAYKKALSNFISIKFYHKSGAFRFFSITILDLADHRIVIGKTIKKEYIANNYVHHNELQVDMKNLFENIETDNIRDFISFKDDSISLMFNLLPIEVWIKDKFGKYIFGNKKYTAAIHMKINDILMKDDFELFHSETAKAFLSTDLQAIDSGKKISYSFETNSKNLAGSAEVTKIPIYNKYKKYIGILGFSIDTTHIKSAEKEIENENTRLKEILDVSGSLVFEINSDGEITYFAGKLSNELGFDSKDSNSINLLSLIPNSSELDEKLKLAFNGTPVSFQGNINGIDIQFRLVPKLKKEGTNKIIGFGNKVDRSNKK